jgi:hypothetical protein
MVGPLLAGFVFTWQGSRAPFFVSAGVLALAALIGLSYHRRHGASFDLKRSGGAQPAS